MNSTPDINPSSLDFTQRAKESMLGTVKDPYFRNKDYSLIYNLLRKEMQFVQFGDFLKRYIYEKAEMNGDYRDIPLSEYQSVICDEFADRQTPCSFTPTSVRLKNAAKNWLEQQTVSRNVVLILGFGLGMSEHDVNRFLTKALQEPGLNAKDPFEVICRYCYRNGFGFMKYEDLWQKYLACADHASAGIPSADETVGYRERLSQIADEASLMQYLAELPIVQGTKRQSVTARKRFNALYGRTRELAARILTESGQEMAQTSAGRLAESLSCNDQLYDYQKLQKIMNEKGNFRVFTADDITPADIESIILAAVPKDNNGNLASMKSSTLNRQFAGKRLSRQHLGEVLSGKAQITRFDLITLNFFIYSQDQELSARERYSAFIESTNRILTECGMSPIYVVNPYECFLLTCMLSEDPLGTYADVWELSYENM
ncbi:MAG: hypothetical protein MJ142_00025 [Clostridia bacterium]|nr:hypothetical protein [Clostridia bacterium]